MTATHSADSTVARIGRALGYDAAEQALASGVSLATVLAMVASVPVVTADDDAPISAYAATVRPAKHAA